MGNFALVWVSVLVVVAQLPLGLAVPSTAPALFWSTHQDGTLEGVNYQTLSPKDLAESIMSQGGWSNFLCSGKVSQPSVDFAFLFVGRELQSLDGSESKRADSTLLELLKDSFTKSSHSLAFPYVVVPEEKGTMASSLISEFAETCGHDLGASNVAFAGSCFVKGATYEKLENILSIHDFLALKRKSRSSGQANLIVFCDGGSGSFKEVDQSLESQVFSEVLRSVERMGAKYSVLYVSEPFRAIQYPTNHDLHRFLAEGTVGNESANSTSCDGVCQIKSSLLEGIFVGLVLLIILISGLCCMMGIDTPTRFEVSQES